MKKNTHLSAVVCSYCSGKCNDRCRTAFVTEPGVHRTVAPSGVVVTSQVGPNIAPVPVYEDEDDWMRFGVVGFIVLSFRMWGVKMRQANPFFFALLTRFVPFAVLATVVALVLKETVR